MENSEPSFNEKDAARVIERALEIQKREGRDSGEPRLTLSDLEKIGRESGITTDLIRRAASEIASGGRPRAISDVLVGGRPLVELRSETGRVPSQTDLQSLIFALPAITGDSGTGTPVGHALVWTSDEATRRRSGRTLSVALGPTPQGSEVRITENLTSIAAGLFAGLIGGLGVGAGLGAGIGGGLEGLGSPVAAVLIPIVTLGGSWLLARGIFRAVLRHRAAKLKAIMQAITAALGGGSASGNEG